ncbi:hypothetical protein [Proteiniclasticum sp. QWL-01]|uniref:hypothetical protein n=1 Tax=Proteiniclasticum sp. QWL-01 TaxID=3036945 RepID=UPI00240FBD6E|nr:hypothetical protein [Proteiniclasticum sp. QWL-01]WFF72695.1 hypothetical protein P6M73_15705 [Proteiniclasticum sp. QWL-01]
MRKLTLRAIQQNIIDETATNYGERVQTSITSDPTADKAMKIIAKTEELRTRDNLIELKVQLIENALSVLSDEEFNIVTRVYFKGQSYTAIDVECGISKRTCQRIKRDAILKLEPLLEVILLINK